MARANTSYDNLFGSFKTLQGLKNAITIFGLDVTINPANYPRAVEKANEQINARYPDLSENEFQAAIRGENPFTSKAVAKKLNRGRLLTNHFGGHVLPSKLVHSDVKSEYKGIDKADRFFEHYGRKGMKRGMNIFNPNYKPIGEKAQGPKAPGAGSSSSKTPSAMSGDSRYAAPKSAADRQREAMNRAAGAATASGAKSTREKLLEAERKRQAKIVQDKYGFNEKDDKSNLDKQREAIDKAARQATVSSAMALKKEKDDREKNVLGVSGLSENQIKEKIEKAKTPEEKGLFMDLLMAQNAYSKAKKEFDKAQTWEHRDEYEPKDITDQKSAMDEAQHVVQDTFTKLGRYYAGVATRGR